MAVIGKTNPHAKLFRLRSTDAEQRLWSHLRNRQLGGFKFRRQVTIGRYVADFACVERRLIIEADGGQHSADGDAQRTLELQDLGWAVLRFWNHDILQQTGAVLDAILIACRGKEEPSPYPLPLAGEGIS